MKRIILQVFAVGMLFAIGQSLECYKCDVGFWKLCFTSKVTCEAGEQCFSGVGEAVGFVNIMMKGCLESSKCNKTDDVNFPSSSSNSTIYTMNKTCCDTNLCNAAPRAPGVPGVGLALATVTALFLAQAMA